MAVEFRGRRPGRPEGEPALFRIVLDAQALGTPAGSAFRLHPGRLESGNDPVMVVSAADPVHGIQLMRQEFDLVDALVHFHGPSGYPPQLTQVLCWDDTLGVPRLLLSWRGRRMSEPSVAEAVVGARLKDAARDLFTGLAGLHAAGAAHGRIRLDDLWWDEPTGLQIGGLEQATVRAQPPARHEDVLAAGRVLFQLACGESIGPDESHAEILSRVGLLDGWVSDLLRQVFRPGAAPPPTAVVADRLSEQPLRRRGRTAADYEQALAAFDSLRARQEQFRIAQQPRRTRRRTGPGPVDPTTGHPNGGPATDTGTSSGAGGSGQRAPARAGLGRRIGLWIRDLVGLYLTLTAVLR